VAPDWARLAGELIGIGIESGLDAVGVAPASRFEGTRRVLEERKALGLHGGMHFTYGDPERSTDPGRALPGAAAILVGAMSYRRGAPGTPPSRPAGQVARYSWGDPYSSLRAALGPIARRLEEEGFRARVLVDDNAMVDKEAARRAGLGWYGKNTLMLLPGKGSWFVLGSVLTDAPLPSGGSAVPDGCGGCARCISACPTGALVEPGVLDARRCLAWALEAPGDFPLELRKALGGRIYGCDDCQEVCPPNKLADRREPPPAPAAGDEPWVDLVEMLSLDDKQLLSRFERWYVPRRQARYLRRNALVALGNVGDGSDPQVESALRSALAHPDPLVRSHAVWAAESVGRPELARA
jgi:epoxyqueuosine reductase